MSNRKTYAFCASLIGFVLYLATCETPPPELSPDPYGVAPVGSEGR